jgi:hypothetical protein
VRLPSKDGNPGACTAVSLVASLARFGNNGTMLQGTKLQRCLHIKTLQATDGSRIHQYRTFLDILGPSGGAGVNGSLGIGMRRRVY